MLSNGLHQPNEDAPFSTFTLITLSFLLSRRAVLHRTCGFLFLFIVNHIAKPHLDVLRLEAGSACGATVLKSPHNLPQLLIARDAIRYDDLVDMDGNVLPRRGSLPVQCNAFGGLDSKRRMTCSGGLLGCSTIPPLQTLPRFCRLPAHQVHFNILCGSCGTLLPVTQQPCLDLPPNETGRLLRQLPLSLQRGPFINQRPCGGQDPTVTRLCLLGWRYDIKSKLLKHGAQLGLRAKGELDGEFGHPPSVGRHLCRAPHANSGDNSTMIRVVMEQGLQTNAPNFPTVGAPTEEVITLGGDPPPTPSHPPHPSPPRQPTGSLKEVFGEVAQAHHILHRLGDLFVSVVPRGAQVDVQITKEEGGVPCRALAPGLYNRC
jgi:hypothetical protein